MKLKNQQREEIEVAGEEKYSFEYIFLKFWNTKVIYIYIYRKTKVESLEYLINFIYLFLLPELNNLYLKSENEI